MSDFQTGDVVVCVSADPISGQSGYAFPRTLVVGAYYRIAWTGKFIDGDDAVELEGDPVDDESAWEAAQFRKIEAPKTFLSHRIRACKPQRVGEPA